MSDYRSFRKTDLGSVPSRQRNLVEFQHQHIFYNEFLQFYILNPSLLKRLAIEG